ncbi:MAG TPA: DNA repair protein RecO [Gammaproteobacteria bacterium]|jgi:DNA repair protein RecO (recombination protein O)|nr:DNA repair protein RecO [Gammaproteobacteria bacterium]
MKRVSIQPAFVLHRRSYRETSFLVELLTPEYGRVTVTAKGARQAKSPSQGLLQPFTPLTVSWAGKGELMTLTQVDANGPVRQLRGESLFAGFYLNELLTALLQKWDPHPTLFKVYDQTLTALEAAPLNEQVLRVFEKLLLEELGYGLLQKDGDAWLQPEKYYRFVPDQGFVISELGEDAKAKSTLFSGKSLLAIANDDWSDEDCMRDAKRLTRFVLAPLLAGKPIHSRRLFLQPEEIKHEE